MAQEKTHRHVPRVRALVAAGACLGTGLTGLALAPSANAATTAAFSRDGVVTIYGDRAANRLVVSRTDAGVITLNGTALRIAGRTPSVENVRQLRVLGNGGDDTLVLAVGAGPFPASVLSGGSGNDRVFGGAVTSTLAGDLGNDLIVGGSGTETLLGGLGNDAVDGNGGADTARLGDGADTFRWEPGDASDTVDGGTGVDAMDFSGNDLAENFGVATLDGHVRFTRDVGNVVMDLVATERVIARTFGGADVVTVAGTAGNDSIGLAGSPADGITVTGLGATVAVIDTGASLDTVHVAAAEGDDVVDASLLAAGVVAFSADGGVGNDVLVGSSGDDVLTGGEGDDVLAGGPGLDQLDGGAGANVLIQ